MLASVFVGIFARVTVFYDTYILLNLTYIFVLGCGQPIEKLYMNQKESSLLFFVLLFKIYEKEWVCQLACGNINSHT